MAAHIDKISMAGLKITRYDKIRPQIQSGDLFFASGDYLMSRMIQDFTDSPWSHVGLIFRADSVDRVLLLESVEDMGVRFAPMSKYLTDYENGKPYKGGFVVARCQGLSPLSARKMAGFGIDELTQPYDKEEIGIIAARIALGIGKKKRDRTYICSELVYECFLKAGKAFTYNKKGFVSPEDLWLDKDVSLTWRLQ